MKSVVGVTLNSTEDPFEAAFRPARPILDMVMQMRASLSWLRKQKRPLLDVARAGIYRTKAVERCELIPKDVDLFRVGKLFEYAETVPAPELWVHVALGVWLDSRPAAANVQEAFRYGIVDSMYKDPETWGGYLPGFSAAVVAQAIREDRRLDTGAAPSAGCFLSMCVKHRDQFRRWPADISELLEVRQNAEDVLIALSDERLAHLGTGDIELESADFDAEWLLQDVPTLLVQGADVPLAIKR
jgi:hypothetical protein